MDVREPVEGMFVSQVGCENLVLGTESGVRFQNSFQRDVSPPSQILPDFRISVVTFLTRFTVSTTEAGLASALPTDLKKRLRVLILFILI